jgi:hypothetical protein
MHSICSLSSYGKTLPPGEYQGEWKNSHTLTIHYTENDKPKAADYEMATDYKRGYLSVLACRMSIPNLLSNSKRRELYTRSAGSVLWKVSPLLQTV